jgi:hypothetical protein
MLSSGDGGCPGESAHVERAFRWLFDEGMTPAMVRRLFSTL